MIHRLTANQASFKELVLTPGFNIVLAERTKESTKRDSRNGLGKSTIIEILHYTLGGSLQRGRGLPAERLKGWAFRLDVDVAGSTVGATRTVDTPGKVRIDGETADWPVRTTPDPIGGLQVLDTSEWTKVLGSAWFGVAPDGNDTYTPSFRSLISYFVRRGRDAFTVPFEHYRKQLEWDKQVHNAFLLGLAWEHAKEWQALKERKGILDNLRRAGNAGLLRGMLGSIGELEARRIRVQGQRERFDAALRNFRVHPQYEDLQAVANRLTDRLHQLVNANVEDRRLVEFYRSNLADESGARQSPEIESIYREAGVVFPAGVRKRLEDVQEFYAAVTTNRRQFLADAIAAIDQRIGAASDEITSITNQRASLLQTLSTHGALEEYSALQRQKSDLDSEIGQIESEITELRKIEEGRSAVRIDQALLLKRARQDYDERRAQREAAANIFNANSQALYQAPGKLVIDVNQNGFQFAVDIERSGSQGISNMKVFCYDLMLAEIWTRAGRGPGFLVHDSTIFDGVDERQVALALELAYQKSRDVGFQYLCTMNSDAIPWGEFTQGFQLTDHVRLSLTDESEDGGVLGIRF